MRSDEPSIILPKYECADDDKECRSEIKTVMGLSLETNSETVESNDLKVKLRMREARLRLNLECARGRDCDIENIGSLSEAQLSMNYATIQENTENVALNRVFLSEA